MTLRNLLTGSFLMSLLSSVGCTSDSKDGFGIFTGSNSDDDDTDILDTNDPDDTDNPNDTASPDDTANPDDTGMDTGAVEPDGEAQEFDEPGDVVVVEGDEGGLATIDLTDASGDNNTDQEFYLIISNAGEDALGYTLEYHVSDGEGNPAAKPVIPQQRSAMKTVQSSKKVHLSESPRQQMAQSPAGPMPPPNTYTSGDVGIARQDFKVRDSIDDENSYERIGAKLWALGSSVAIWVDDSVAVDWDYDCDGTIDQPAPYDAYGFDNCDLQEIADIVDYNIFPNLRGYYGDESDENGDGMVSVVITPVLNQMTRNNEEDAEITFVGSYADPAVDLETFDPDNNPGSDEQEVIYVFAPDPYGFHNPNALTTIEGYTSVELSAQISSAFYKLISYNQHVIVQEGDQEENWVSLGLGALAADLTGFGASNHVNVWNYLDSSHLSSLTVTEESGAISTSPFGAQYLFFRWLADAYGVDQLSGIVQSADVGSENIEAVIGEDLENLVQQWQVALMSSASTQGAGGLDVDTTSYPPYVAASTITAPTTNPAEGDLYGANGYQLGIDVGSDNFYTSGGLSTPVENADRRVRLGHTDHSTAVFGQDFYGYVEAGYGAQVVRLTDIPFNATQIEVRSSSSDYKVAVVRADDPGYVNFARDILYSPTDVNNTILPLLPSDGSPIYGIGEISASGVTLTIDTDGNQTSSTVYDTDRWLVDLSNFPIGQSVKVVGWLDHRYEDVNGTVDLTDPWMAIVPRAYLPVPTVTGTQTGACTDGVSFGYPFMLLEYLYSQVLLSPTSYEESEMFSLDSSSEDTGGSVEMFDPCGSQEDATTCDEDWDRDNVLDENEPTPSTFLGQVQVMQCTLAGNDASGFVPLGTDIFDMDQTDDDDSVSLDRQLNLGGVSVDEEEGAYIDIELTGGQQYVLVVGSQGTGPYEFTLKALVP